MNVAAVENETPTEPEPVEPEPTEPEPAPTVTPEQMEKFYKGLATRTATLNRWIEGELGDNYADLSACPLCADGIVGHIYPPEWMEATTELQGRLLDVLRTPGEPNYPPDPNTRECGVCGGYGKTQTRGHVPGKQTRVCRTCKGLGYLSNDGPEPVATNGAPLADEYELPDTEPLSNDLVDNWGTPKFMPDGQENPNWGRQPNYWDKSLPHGAL